MQVCDVYYARNPRLLEETGGLKVDLVINFSLSISL